MSVYRKLFPTEFELYQQHLLRLDDHDRYSRFAGTVTESNITSYCTGIDPRYTVLIGFFDRGDLRGVTEVRWTERSWPSRAEIAFSVERPFQNRGVGGTLMRRAMLIARNRGTQVLDVVCLLENRRMQAMARKYAKTIEVDGGEVFVSINLEKANEISFLIEAIDDGESMVTTLLDQMQYRDKAHVPFHGWSA